MTGCFVAEHLSTCGRPALQTLSDLLTCALQVPAGSLPRTMDVILRNDIVEAVRAGDKVSCAARITAVFDGQALWGLTPGLAC
jgi:MCM OB domain